MAIADYLTGKGRATGTGPTLDVTVDCGTGSDRLLVALIALRGNATQSVSGITYNGDAMTKATSQSHTSSNIDTEIWYLVNPDTGSNTMQVTFSGLQCEAMGLAFTGVKQTSPLDQTAGAEGTSSTPSVSITPTENNELVVGVLIHESSTASSVGSGETSIYDTDQGAWNTSASFVVQTTAGAQTVDWSNGTSDVWTVSAASFKEATSGSITVTPAAAVCVVRSIAPTTVLGSVVATPAVAKAVVRSINPTAILGSLAATPAVATAIVRTIDPTVLAGGLIITPAAAVAVVRTMAPAVVLGSIVAVPAVASHVVSTIAPTVVLGSVTAIPAFVAAVIVLVGNITVINSGDTDEGWKWKFGFIMLRMFPWIR